MTNNVFQLAGNFYRGNLHTHSNQSDGILGPEEVCRRYREEGYDFVVLTDHFVGQYDYPIVDTVPYRTNQFTTILGAELHSGTMQNGEIWHILAVGLPSDFKPSYSPDFRPTPGQESGPDIAERARAAGAFVAIAHPQWSGLTMEDARSIEAAHAVEVYNHSCAVDSDRPDGWHTLDLLLSEGKRLNACATDDAHFTADDHFGGWVMVKAETNEPETLLSSLKKGNFYSSQGPLINNVDWYDNHVEVQTSPVNTVIVQGQGSRTIADHTDRMTSTKIPLKSVQHSPWHRITIIDNHGKKAWTNPVWKR